MYKKHWEENEKTDLCNLRFLWLHDLSRMIQMKKYP